MPALPVYFISHGGGPWPWMPEQRRTTYRQLEAALAHMPSEWGRKPRALLVISAHWEAPAFTVMTHPQPPMLYDYGGFPPHTYQVQYPAPGHPVLAAQVHGLIEAAGLPAATDATRGFDHGLFSPMAVMLPEADLPIVQLSLRRGLDPAEHLALGRALSPLRGDDVLIIGSGL
ncbi:MAG: class III extradiol ring-cleavage dioxygenase, partial [Variovorax sp.]